MRRRLLIVFGLLVACAVAARAGEVPIAVIVHPGRSASLSADDVARIYLGQRRFWDDGAAIVALNLPAGDTLRERFSRRVFRAESARLASYWNAQYFHGVFPPAVLSSPDAVKRYVANDPKAVGYIEADDADATVRVVLTLE